MTKLEKLLIAALAAVTTNHVYTVVTTIKHNREHAEDLTAIENGLNRMGQVLDEAEKRCKAEEES